MGTRFTTFWAKIWGFPPTAGCAWSGDLPRLADLCAALRQRLEDSPLCDGPAYARNVEDAFRAMWDARAGGKDKDHAS